MCALTAAYEKAELDGYLKPSIQKITDVIEDAKSLEEAIDMNAEAVAEEIRKLIKDQGLDAKVLTAYETLETGKVEFNI